MALPRPSTREKILAAAAAVARETGPGSLSLEAVAARAGISKGGLLYNFPSKAKLLQSLVATYVAEFERALDAAVAGGAPLAAAFVRLTAEAADEDHAPASWIFSAIAEDPDFLAPVTRHRRELRARLKAEATDLSGLLLIFLAMEGLRSTKLFDADILDADDRAALLERALAMAADATSAPA